MTRYSQGTLALVIPELEPEIKPVPKTGSFSGRISIADPFQIFIFEEIESMGFLVALNGTEHTHPDFAGTLRASSDQTSLAIRFQPDGVAAIAASGKVPCSFYVEAKASSSIEKTAYEQYIKLHASGNVLVIVFGEYQKYQKIGQVRGWCFIEELPLIDGKESVRGFSENQRFPVVDGWLHPPKSKIRHKGSGTPFRYVNIAKLRQWKSFKSDMINRLGEEYNSNPHNSRGGAKGAENVSANETWF